MPTLRIISGSLKGRKITAPKSPIEPTKGIVKESLFNIIGSDISGKSFLDLYSGSGNVAIEAYSRGAGFITMVESNPICVKALQNNINSLQIKGNIIVEDVFLYLQKKSGTPFDYIFADPPYDDKIHHHLLSTLVISSFVNQSTIIILESSSKLEIKEIPPPLLLSDQRKYGITLLSFFSIKQV